MSDESAPEPLLYQGWRRRRGSADAWQIVKDAEGTTIPACWQSLILLSEMAFGESKWEYQILLAGESPQHTKPLQQTYKDRAMRPAGGFKT